MHDTGLFRSPHALCVRQHAQLWMLPVQCRFDAHQPFAIQVIEVSGDKIVGHHNFVDTDLFAAFGLPDHLRP